MPSPSSVARSSTRPRWDGRRWRPGVYFRSLLIGYFEGLDSERLIAWRMADSISLRRFVAIELDESTPDHSTISRTRRLIDVETHREVFTWVLQVIAQEGMLKGGTIAVDATTLEANAALRSIVRRDTGERYDEFLKRLAVESGIETPTKEQLAQLDKKRKNKGSNDDWTHPQDPDAKIGKMKDGRTHLAHKAEQAVDLETGAVLAVTLEGAGAGDTATLAETVIEAAEQLAAVAENKAARRAVGGRRARRVGSGQGLSLQRSAGGSGGARDSQLYQRTGSRAAADGGTRRQPKRRCTGTGDGYEASAASDCCGSAASGWNAALRTYTRRAGCDERIYEDTRTFSNAC